MRRLALLAGFLVSTLVFVTADHLTRQVLVGEVVDSMGTSLVFTGLFAIGLHLGAQAAGRPRTARQDALRGCVAGLAVQLVIWCFWLLFPHEIRYSFGTWPLVGHVVLVVGAGFALNRLWTGRVRVGGVCSDVVPPA